MHSVGNDLVYLQTRFCRGRAGDLRFVDKVLHPHEKELLRHAAHPDPLLWLCWSVKEAAYKCCRRLDPAFSFAPTKIFVSHLAGTPVADGAPDPATRWHGRGFAGLNRVDAEVAAPGHRLFARSLVREAWVYTVVGTSPEILEKVRWGVRRIGAWDREAQSAEVREFTAGQVAAARALGPDCRITFGKHAAGFPELYIDGDRQEDLVSFTHDHAYVGYALCPS